MGETIKDIKFVRSDTFMIKFQRKDANDEVIPSRADEVWLTVKENYKTDKILIQKKLSDGTINYDEKDYSYHSVLRPEDTMNLKYKPKKYVYDIQVLQSGIITTIASGKLFLSEEVTFERS